MSEIKVTYFDNIFSSYREVFILQDIEYISDIFSKKYVPCSIDTAYITDEQENKLSIESKVENISEIIIRNVPKGMVEDALYDNLTKNFLNFFIWVGTRVVKMIKALFKGSLDTEDTETPDPTKLPGLNGANNTSNPDGKLPCILGVHRITPYYATTPYTTIGSSSSSVNDSGNELYLNLLFAIGYAPLKISDIQIGGITVASGEFTSSGGETSLVFDGPYGGLTGVFCNGAIPSAYSKVVNETQVDTVLNGYTASNINTTFTIDATNKYATAPSGTSLDDDLIMHVGDVIKFSGFSNGGNNNYFAIANITTSDGVSNNRLVLEEESYGLVNETASVSWFVTPSNILESPDNTTDLNVIVTFPYGLARYYSDSADPALFNADLVLKAYYRAKGTSNWTSFPYFHGSSYNLKSIFSADETIRLETSVSGLTAGTYQIRVARETGIPSAEDSSFYSEVQWSVLKCTTSEDVWDTSSTDTSFLYMKVKATTALSNSLGKISLLAKAIYSSSVTGVSWTEDEAYIDSPAAAYLWALTGPYNPRPVESGELLDYIDYDAIEDWRDYCAQVISVTGDTFHTCNAVVTETQDMKSFVTNICSTGRAYYTMNGEKYSVVWDEEVEVNTQVITPRNSWNFQATRTFEEIPKVYLTTYVNKENDYTQETIYVHTYGGADTDTPKEAITLWGCTSFNEVQRESRYLLACSELRREDYTVYMDVEELCCTLGDRVLISHDALLIGYSWGRIKDIILDISGNITGVITDEPVVMETGTSYSVRIRSATGSVYIAVVTEEGETNTINFASSYSSDTFEIGDLFQFGVTNEESIPCIIYGIEIQPDLSAKLSLFQYNENVYLSDNQSVPSYTSKVSRKPIFTIARLSDEVIRSATELSTSVGKVAVENSIYPTDIPYIRYDFDSFTTNYEMPIIDNSGNGNHSEDVIGVTSV